MGPLPEKVMRMVDKAVVAGVLILVFGPPLVQFLWEMSRRREA